MFIHYEITDVDHIPISVDMDIQLLLELSSETNDCRPRLKWDRRTTDNVERYRCVTDEKLANISIPNDICCNNINCDNTLNILQVKQFYNEIVTCLIKSGEEVTPGSTKKQNVNKPGWSVHVAELYKAPKDAYKTWASNGKPRNGPIYEMYRSSRAQCKYAIRYIQSNEDRLRRESLAKALSQHNYKSFWKEIRHMNNCRTPLPTSIDGVSGDKSIAELWGIHFSDLLNCIHNENNSNLTPTQNFGYEDVRVDSTEVDSAIKNLEVNKACGLDGIYAEHLKYRADRLYKLLSLCITSFLVHGILPDSMLGVVLVPVIKDKSGRINAKDNNRPIALASIVSKVVENILLDRMSMFLVTRPNQCGFKKKHGTDMCMS